MAMIEFSCANCDYFWIRGDVFDPCPRCGSINVIATPTEEMPPDDINYTEERETIDE